MVQFHREPFSRYLYSKTSKIIFIFRITRFELRIFNFLVKLQFLISVIHITYNLIWNNLKNTLENYGKISINTYSHRYSCAIAVLPIQSNTANSTIAQTIIKCHQLPSFLWSNIGISSSTYFTQNIFPHQFASLGKISSCFVAERSNLGLEQLEWTSEGRELVQLFPENVCRADWWRFCGIFRDSSQLQGFSLRSNPSLR